jgi:hypothetical protein
MTNPNIENKRPAGQMQSEPKFEFGSKRVRVERELSSFANSMAILTDVLLSIDPKDQQRAVRAMAGMVGLSTQTQQQSSRSFAEVLKTSASVPKPSGTLKVPSTVVAPKEEPTKKAVRNGQKKVKVTPPKPNVANKDPKVKDLKVQLAAVRSAMKGKAKTLSVSKLPKDDDLVIQNNKILAAITVAKSSFCGFTNLKISKTGPIADIVMHDDSEGCGGGEATSAGGNSRGENRTHA